MANGTIPWYSAWYPLLYVATLGQATGYDDLRVPSVVLLSIAMGAKGAVALWVLGRARARRWVTLAAVLFVMLVVPLKLGAATNFYLGKVTPTIWHNSTTILAMPFSLLLFVVAVDVLRRAEARWTATAGLAALLVLSLSAKPNYGLLFLPVFGVYALVLAVRGSGPDRWRPLGRYLVVAVVGVAVLGLQYWGTYATGAVTYENRLDPLTVWRAFTPDVPLAMAESLLLPVRGHRGPLARGRGPGEHRAGVVLHCSGHRHVHAAGGVRPGIRRPGLPRQLVVGDAGGDVRPRGGADRGVAAPAQVADCRSRSSSVHWPWSSCSRGSPTSRSWWSPPPTSDAGPRSLVAAVDPDGAHRR